MKHSRSVQIVCLVLCLLVLSGTARAKNDWVTVQSKNFTLVGDASDKEIRLVALKLEQYRETLRLLFPKSNVEREIPTLVYVFDSHNSFRPFKPRVDGKIQENVAGFFAERPDAVYVAVTAEERGGLTPYEAIFHEYYHYVLDNNFNNPPPWLNEGLAEFYSSFEMKKDGKSFRIGEPIPRHFYSFRERQIMPLEKLLSTSYKNYSERNKDNILYAESWALVHYLMLGNDGKRREQFSQFINRLNSGLPLAENFQQSFQTDFKGMESELRNYIRRPTLPFIEYTSKDAVAFESAMQSRPLTDAEIELQLGKLSWNTGEREAAVKRFEKAVALAPTSAPALTWLGFTRWAKQKPDEAEKMLKRAVEIDANDYLSHTYLAFLFASQEKRDEAVAEYQTAIRLQPKMARLEANLAAYHSGAGNDAQAFAGYSRAIRLNAQNPTYLYSSCIIALRLKRGAPAAQQAQGWLRLRGWDKDSSPYAALVAYFGFRQLKQKNDADKLIQIAAERLSKDVWAYQIVRYLQRQISADELLKIAAADKDKLTEAHCYIGMDFALDGKTAEAAPHLEWVRDNGNRNFIEYGFAVSALNDAKTATGGQ